MPPRAADPTSRTIQAGLLAWIIPGAGHYFLGQRALAAVFFLAITLPYAVGLAVGGVVNSVNPRTNKWLFLAELGVGGYTVPGYLGAQRIERGLLRELGLSAIPQPEPRRSSPAYERWIAARARYVAYYPESDVAQIYLATAGLLNLLAILDAISRAQTGGLPTYHRELQTPAAPAEGGTP